MFLYSNVNYNSVVSYMYFISLSCGSEGIGVLGHCEYPHADDPIFCAGLPHYVSKSCSYNNRNLYCTDVFKFRIDDDVIHDCLVVGFSPYNIPVVVGKLKSDGFPLYIYARPDFCRSPLNLKCEYRFRSSSSHR